MSRELETLVTAINMLTDVEEALRDGRTLIGPRGKFETLLCRAIAYQRQVTLGYDGSVRTVEPHMLRETKSGRVVLYGMRIEKGMAPQVRSYRLDRIETITVTNSPFVGPERE